MNRQIEHCYEFGDYQVCSTQRILLCSGKHIRLEPKTFETLLMLVEQYGRVVHKQELMERVWPDAFVEEINLTKNISTLRKTLSNEHESSIYIETIPKVGYRFIAEVRLSTNGEEQPLVAPVHRRHDSGTIS